MMMMKMMISILCVLQEGRRGWMALHLLKKGLAFGLVWFGRLAERRKGRMRADEPTDALVMVSE